MTTINQRYNVLLPGNCVICGRPVGTTDTCHECSAWRDDCDRRAKPGNFGSTVYRQLASALADQIPGMGNDDKRDLVDYLVTTRKRTDRRPP